MANTSGTCDDTTEDGGATTGATTPGPGCGTVTPTLGGGMYLRSKLRSALSSSNDIISSISNRLSMLSSASSQASDAPQLPTTPPEQQQTLATREWVEGACAAVAAAEMDSDMPGTPESKNSLTVTKFKEKFKLENLQENLQELRPALEDFMASDESSEPSTLPTNTPPHSPGIRERLRAAINPAFEKTLGDCKAMAIRTLSGGESGAIPTASAVGTSPYNKGSGGGTLKDLSKAGGSKRTSACAANCSIKVDLVSDAVSPKDRADAGGEGNSVCVSSQSFNSIHSLHATGPDPYDKLRLRNTVSSGSISDVGGGNSTSLDSTDSDPHRKLWIRDGSQNSLQSWASSLSYDSQAEDSTNPKEFMRMMVENIFKAPSDITEDNKKTFTEMAKSEVGRLWFARCINGKRCCRCVEEETFFALIHYFTQVLNECAETDDFSPAKSLMYMCFIYYYEPKLSGENKPRPPSKDFLYVHLRDQPIWTSIRFWNAAFFDALQCERTLRPVARQELETPSSKDQAMLDELRYQENITFGQLGTFTCNMHAFGLSKEMVTDFLRKQVTIASLRTEQVKLLRENVNRLYSEQVEWK